MFTHIVLFTLKNNSLTHKRTVRKRLLTLRDHIPLVRDIEVGIDEYGSPRSAHIALIVRFDSQADEAAYQQHPYHQEILAYMRKVITAGVSADFSSDLK